MPPRRLSQHDVSRKLRLEVLERRDFLAVDLLPPDECIGGFCVPDAPAEVVSTLSSDDREIVLKDGKRVIIEGNDNGVLILPDGTEEPFVGIEIVHDPNQITESADGSALTTAMGWYEPPGKQLIGSYTKVLRETEHARYIARYYVYGRLPVVELADGKRLIFERDHEGMVIHPDGTEEPFVGIEVIHNRTVSDRDVTRSTVLDWSTPPQKPLIGTYTEVLWQSGESRIIAHYDVYGLPGAEVPPPAEPESPTDPDTLAPPTAEESPESALPPALSPVAGQPQTDTPQGDLLVYYETPEGTKLARLSEVPLGVFFWRADPPAPTSPPTPEEIQNAVVTFADRSGNVATTTIAQGPLPGVWAFYWLQDARIRLPADWFAGADITWDHQTLDPPIPQVLPPD